MIEYVVVLLAIRKAEHKVALVVDCHSDSVSFKAGKLNQKQNKNRSDRAKARLAIRQKNQFCYAIDRMAFVTFAASFAVFNIIYVASYQ